MFLTVSGGIAHTNYSATQYTPKHSGLFMRLANRPPSFWRKNGNEGPLQLSCLADRPPIDHPQLSTPINLLSNSKQIPHINLWAIFYGTLIVYRLSVALPIIWAICAGFSKIVLRFVRHFTHVVAEHVLIPSYFTLTSVLVWEMRALTWKDTCTPMFIAALLQ